MIHPLIDPIEWARRYGLSLKERACAKCGEMQVCDQPFAHRGWRGLQSSHTKCGEQYRQSTMISLDDELAGFVELWKAYADEK